MDNLKDKTAKGIAWGAVNNGTTQVLNLVFGIVLARKLSTEDYGLVAVLVIFTALAGCIQAAGFSQALANLKPPTKRDYSAVFWFNIIAGSLMYVALFFCAPLIAGFFHAPVLKEVSRVVFLSIPISSLGIVPNAKLWIELRNRELAIAAIVALLISGCTGMWLAFHEYAYWSLVWQQLIFIGVSTIIKWYFTRWHPLFPIDLRPIRSMLGFSSKMLLTNMLNVVSQNVMTFIFARLLPMATVGLFNQANKWNTMGHSFISNTMSQVAQPVLAQTDNEVDRQKRVLRKMLRFTSFVCFPLMLGLALVAEEFIQITIGDKWLPSVPLLQILCIGGCFIPIQSLFQNYIISQGRSDIYLYFVGIQIIAQIGVTLLLARQGIIAMVAAYSLLNVLFSACWHAVSMRLHHLSVVDVMKDVIPFLLVTVAIIVPVYWFTETIEPLWLLLIVRVILVGGLYAAIMWLLNVAIMKECLQFIIHKKK